MLTQAFAEAPVLLALAVVQRLVRARLDICHASLSQMRYFANNVKTRNFVISTKIIVFCSIVSHSSVDVVTLMRRRKR